MKLSVLLATLAPLATAAAMSVSLEPSFSSPAGVGDTVIWTATTADTGSAAVWYRFRVRTIGEEFRTAIDYGPENWFAWTPAAREGVFEVEASVRNRETGETAVATRRYAVVSRVTAGRPVITATIHPLVMLYSAPACPPGSSMRVEFQPAGGQSVSTPAKACTGDASMNFYLAGMRGGTQYQARHVLSGPAGQETGPTLPFQVEPLWDGYFAGYQLLTDPLPGTWNEVLLQSTTLTQKAVATDLAGNLIWFYPHPLVFLTRPEPGGTFFAIQQVFGGAGPEQQVLKEIDLTGTTLRETNAARVNEQLAARGERGITSFHHEAGALPGGKILVLASTEQILTDVQGAGPVNVIGEKILVLSPDLQVEWSWDAFDHLDPARPAVLGETCRGDGAGCPPYFLTRAANDWLHANSVTLAQDGDLVMSIRHLDWVVKIDYAHGQGSGRILWRLGKDGDFRLLDSEEAWFSHQHDAVLHPDGELSLFDNANTRAQADPGAVSRGQVWKLDQVNLTATLVLNAPLGVYSPALGSAQRLRNGNYHFGIGWVGAAASRSVEVSPGGQLLYDIKAEALAYRTFRMPNLYGP